MLRRCGPATRGGALLRLLGIVARSLALRLARTRSCQALMTGISGSGVSVADARSPRVVPDILASYCLPCFFTSRLSLPRSSRRLVVVQCCCCSLLVIVAFFFFANLRVLIVILSHHRSSRCRVVTNTYNTIGVRMFIQDYCRMQVLVIRARCSGYRDLWWVAKHDTRR